MLKMYLRSASLDNKHQDISSKLYSRRGITKRSVASVYSVDKSSRVIYLRKNPPKDTESTDNIGNEWITNINTEVPNYTYGGV